MKRIGVWHRDDLRVRDNKALYKASENGIVVPIFIFDPGFYSSEKVSDGRIEFLHECLEQLDDEYTEIGNGLSYLHGRAEAEVDELISTGKLDRVYFNLSVSSGYARRRDKRMKEKDYTLAFSDDAIVRNKKNSRDGWREQAENYFDSDTIPKPESISNFDSLKSSTSIDDINSLYSVESDMNRRHHGGCKRAQKRVENFVENIEEYVGGISPPAEAEERTSQLSPYLKFGCISPRQAYKYAVENSTDGQALNMFTSRLFWNQHFTQKLQDNRNLHRHSVNPVFRGINRGKHDPELHKKWKNGNTGYPLVDASMRSLDQTGWMNFRMRAMCASFYTYILRCWWKKGADWFYRKLIDADSAINYAQWQMQSGLVGVHPLRIYNPRKQVRDNDPDGEFIKKYVPELRDFPSKFLDRPEKAPLSVQEECGVRIGDDYPYPIVDFERRRKESREYWSSLDTRAKEALKDPEVFRRASLSSDSREKLEEDSQDSKGQSQLGDFT